MRTDFVFPPDALIGQADALAAQVHAAQRCRFTDTPYVDHVRSVARMVNLAGAPADVVAAALLHDVMKYSPIDERYLREWGFGPSVVDLVIEYHNHYPPEKYPALNRATRMKFEAERIYGTSMWAQNIRAANLLDDLWAIVTFDLDFRGTFLAEARDLAFERMTKADPLLLEPLKAAIRAAERLVAVEEALT